MSCFINPDIFREYDIRGIADRDLTSPVVESLGRAFAAHIRPKGISTVAVGYDARLSSARLRDALIQGLTASGMTVTDLGLCPTPVLYFSLHHRHFGAGVMITGSHNPPEFNGFKLCVGKDTIYGEEIQKIKQIMTQNSKKGQGSGGKCHGTTGKEQKVISHELRATHHPIIHEYIDYLKTQFQTSRDLPLKVVLDSGNGTAGLAAPGILRHMGCEVIELFSEPDGTFPNHHPDPTIPANLTVLIETVRAERADVGIAFDGDADRVGVVDEQGNILWGDQLMAIFARDILGRQPGATFVSEVKCSQTMYDDIRAHGGNAIMWKTGHSLIKAKMKEVAAALAGEMSGHLFFADRYFGYDDAIYAACRLVEILKNIKSTQRPDGLNRTTLSLLLSDLPKTFNTPEIRIDCNDHIKFMVVDRMREIYVNWENTPLKPQELITVDGVRAVFEKGWGLIRASNTQPVLVMRFEANDPTSLAAIKEAMVENLNKILTDLTGHTPAARGR